MFLKNCLAAAGADLTIKVEPSNVTYIFDNEPRNREICKQIGVSRDTLKNWIKDRNFPEPLKSSGREPLFDQLSVKEWLLNEGGNNE